MSQKINFLLVVAVTLLAADIVLRLGAFQPSAVAQSATMRQPIALTAAPTDGGNFLLYRMWSDGSIDVRLVNPLRTQAIDWPKSDRAGISFQEKWKLLQVGE